MMTVARSWLKDNSTLVYFLIAQAIALGAAGASMLAYSVRLETRVTTLEIRGSPHLQVIDNRLTVLESKTTENKRSIDRVVDVMTKELHVSPTRDR
jgi:uncharacterized coiled-coil protein SlyX